MYQRAGIVGADGPTHAGVYDIPFLRCVPNISIACPADENECRMLLSTAHAQDHTVAVRYPRGSGAGTALSAGLDTFPFGKGDLRRQGQGVAILAFGTMLYPALQAPLPLNASLAPTPRPKPLPTQLLPPLAQSPDELLTLDDAGPTGRAASAVFEALADPGLTMTPPGLGAPPASTEY